MEPLLPYLPRLEAIPLGPVGIQPWGILVATGFLVGGRVAEKRCREAGLDASVISPLVVWLVVAAAVGGHLGHALFYQPRHYLANPLELLKVWDGLSSYGGFLLAVPTTVWFFRRHRLPWWNYAECLAYGMAPGWMFGRLGCFVVHDHVGVTTTFWLGMKGICREGPSYLACHELGLYDALLAAALWGGFAILGRKPRFTGFFLALLTLIYGLCRFGFDFLRDSTTDTRYLGLTPAQYGSLAMAAVGVGIFLNRRGAPLQGKHPS